MEAVFGNPNNKLDTANNFYSPSTKIRCNLMLCVKTWPTMKTLTEATIFRASNRRRKSSMASTAATSAQYVTWTLIIGELSGFLFWLRLAVLLTFCGSLFAICLNLVLQGEALDGPSGNTYSIDVHDGPQILMIASAYSR